MSVFKISETPTLPPPPDADEEELPFEEPQAASVAPRQTLTPIAATRVRLLRRLDAWLEEMFIA
ncbi:hypothetical protein [Streptomyces gilvosporeus]|uniref:hypothetical protein n=1 Tax=Streptomyces gilvosporeus TaxID=553510 RepID=UPI001F394377|nr:hypothetical protein [Streptomyces gilvosporeus]